MDSWTPVLVVTINKLLQYLFLGIQNLPFLRHSILTLILIWSPYVAEWIPNPAAKRSFKIPLVHLQKLSTSSLLAQSNPIFSWTETLWLFNLFLSWFSLCSLRCCTGCHIFYYLVHACCTTLRINASWTSCSKPLILYGFLHNIPGFSSTPSTYYRNGSIKIITIVTMTLVSFSTWWSWIWYVQQYDERSNMQANLLISSRTCYINFN